MSSSAFDPYHRWLAIPPKDQPPHHYRLLAVELYESDADVISTAADQRMVHLKTFQGGANATLSQRLLNEVAAARVCLLNADQKAAYDAQLRAKLGGPKPETPKAAPRPRVVPQARPIAPQADAASPGIAGLEALVGLTAGELDGSRGKTAGKRKRGGKKTGWNGPGKYPLIVLGVGIIGLALMLWVRANHLQIQLVDADQTPATGKTAAEKRNERPGNTVSGGTPASHSGDTSTKLSSQSQDALAGDHARPAIASAPLTSGQVHGADPKKLDASPGADWVELVPTEMVSSNGATLELQPDRSVVVFDASTVGSYTIKAATHLTGITGFRLEVLTDARLPCAGPGRSTGGNFILSEFNVTAASLGDPSKTSQVPLRNVRADFNQEGWPSAASVDGNPGTGWGVHPNTGMNHVAVFEAAAAIGYAGGTVLTFVLDQQHPGAQLGGFRLSVTTDATPPSPAASVTPSKVDLKSRIQSSPVPTGEYTPQTWRYTFDRPPNGWERPDFNDSAWASGAAGFGQSEFITPRTLWNTPDIWLRRDFDLADLERVPSAIRTWHDEDLEVCLNGVVAVQFGGFSGRYVEYEIPPAARRKLKAGQNVLAVHCHQTWGGQFIDVGLLCLRPLTELRPFKEVKTVRGKSIDLLELIDPERDTFAGRWTLADGVLTSLAEGITGIQIPYAPSFEYKLIIVGERDAGSDLMVGLVAGGAPALVVLDGWGGTITGISGVDGKPANANPTTKQIANVLGSGREYKVICSVRGRHIEVQVNGATVINWTGTLGEHALGPEWAVPTRDQLFLGAVNAVHHIKSITLIPKSTAPNGPASKASSP